MDEWEVYNVEKDAVLNIELLKANILNLKLQLMLITRQIPDLQEQLKKMEETLLNKISESGKYTVEDPITDFKVKRKLNKEIL